MLINQLSQTLSLNGTWDFALGDREHWEQIQVPGCWEAQGYPKTIDGPAYYRRQVFIPGEWSGERIFIEFGAVSYACTVSCNGVPIEEHLGLWTPFMVDISSAAHPGENNLIELEIYKPGQRHPMRSCLAGFLPDVATSFGGPWQPVCLRAMSVGLKDLQVDPDINSGEVHVRCQVVSYGQLLGPGAWEVGIFTRDRLVASQIISLENRGSSDHSTLDVTLAVPEPARWSPESPSLYELSVRLLHSHQTVAEANQRFAFRCLEAQEGLLYFNGQTVLLRGVLSWGWQPDLIAPAYSVERARDEIRRVKALGFNLIKLCLFIPDQTYFDIADEEGIFLWEELPLWQPQITPDLRSRAPGEYAAITRLTHHHPSVVVYSLGCELDMSVDADLLNQLNKAVRGLVLDVLVCDNSGSGESYGGLDYDLSDFTDYHPYYDLHYFEPLLENWRRDWLPARPWIFGEFSDSDGFRDLDELAVANGGRTPWWLTDENPVTAWRPESHAMVEAASRLAKASLGLPPAELVRIAAAQSLLSRKFTLEALRRRSGMGGYVVTGLRDTPIATSGVFDDLDRPKWPVESIRTFNDDAILCLETGRRRRWTHGGDRPDRLDAYNHWAGPESEAIWHIILSTFAVPLEPGALLAWRLRNLAGETLASGQTAVDRWVSPGVPARVGTINCSLPTVERAREVRLEVNLTAPGLTVSNAWPIWIYPPIAWQSGLGLYDPSGVQDGLGELPAIRLDDTHGWTGVSLAVASGWCEQLQQYLLAGGKVLLLQGSEIPLPARRGPFWRENLKLFSAHPLWQVFPHQGYASLQFFGLASDVILDAARLAEALPGVTQVTPIMRRLDSRQYTVGEYLLEANVGRGHLLACALRLLGGAGAQPAGLQHNTAGAYMLWALIDYLLNHKEHEGH